MYKVTVTVQPFNPNDESERYSKSIFEGFFIPKNEDTPTGKIKAQVIEYLSSRILDKSQPHIKTTITGVKIKKAAYNFIVCEDKLS